LIKVYIAPIFLLQLIQKNVGLFIEFTKQKSLATCSACALAYIVPGLRLSFFATKFGFSVCAWRFGFRGQEKVDLFALSIDCKASMSGFG